MMKPFRRCIYCRSSGPLSKEHIVSRTVLKELFGENIVSTTSIKIDGQWKMLSNFEPTKKDVCRKCNSSLSIYDSAGLAFVKSLNENHDKQKAILAFDSDICGWLIKTHLNIIRFDEKKFGESITINPHILRCLIERKPVSNNLFWLLVQGIDVKSDFWKTEKSVITTMATDTGKINERNAIYSHLRIKYLDTFLIIPKNGNDYSEFPAAALDADTMIHLTGWPYVERIDVDKVVQENKFKLEKKFSEDEFKRGLVSIPKK